jgi:hypothetical protein
MFLLLLLRRGRGVTMFLWGRSNLRDAEVKFPFKFELCDRSYASVFALTCLLRCFNTSALLL